MSVYKDKNNGTWYIKASWYDSNKKRHYLTRRGFPNKRTAQKKEIELLAEKNKGNDILANPSFADYYDKWVEIYKGSLDNPKASVAPNTIREYLTEGKRIRNGFGNTKIKSINRTRYQEFINDFGSNHAKNTVKKLNNAVKACVRSAIHDGIIIKNFTEDISLVYNNSTTYKVKYLQNDEIIKLYNYLKENRKPKFTGPYMLMTMIMTGLRESEVAGLTWDDIDFEHNILDINKAWVYTEQKYGPTKNGSSARKVSIPNSLLKLIAELKINGSKQVFWSPVYNSIPGSKGLTEGLRTALGKIGINAPGFHPHSLRHSQVALLLNADINIYDISQRLGHANTKTTEEIYAYEFSKYREKINQKINKAFENM